MNKTVLAESHQTATWQLLSLNLRICSGKRSEWESFRDTYRSRMHRSENTPLIDKLHFLRFYVRAKAQEIVHKYSVSEENYDAAWKELMAYYENKRRLVHSHLYEFFPSSR